MKSIAFALLAAFAVVSVTPTQSYAEQNNILMDVSTTRFKTRDAKGTQPQKAPVVTPRSNKKHGISDQAAPGNLSSFKR